MKKTQQENASQFNSDWKRALVYLSNEDLVSIPLCQNWDADSGYEELEMFVESFTNIEKLKATENISSKIQIADIANRMNIRLRNYGVVYITPVDKAGQEIKTLNIMQNRDEESDEYIDVKDFVLTLNPKGLETVLKLQEHDDNERRFTQQAQVSKQLKRNSTVSAAAAVCALLIAGGVYLNALEIKTQQKIFGERTLSNSENQLNLSRRRLKLIEVDKDTPQRLEVEITHPLDVSIIEDKSQLEPKIVIIDELK